VAFFEKLPSWLLFVSVRDVFGAFAYTQLFAFFESLVVCLGLVLASVLLPRRVLRDKFVSQAAMLALLLSTWAIVLQLIFLKHSSWSVKTLALWSIPCLIAIGVSYLLIERYRRVEQAIRSLVERLSVLTYVYVFLTVVSVIAILLRNI
jgi:hypothetical protein